MRKTWFIVVAAFMTVGLAACSTPTEESDAPEPRAFSSAPSAETESVAVPSSDPTAPCEVCDPGNANDAICAAFYPETALNNMLQRQKEPVGQMSSSEQSELAQQACDAMDSGSTWETAVLVENSDNDSRVGYPITNKNLYTAAAYGYCQPHLELLSTYGAWLVAHYQGIGEAAAKVEFADGSMPEGSDEFRENHRASPSL